MVRDLFIKDITPKTINLCPQGFIADELTPEQFYEIYPIFFEQIFEISKADISHLSGYGEFDENNQASYPTCRRFMEDTFSNEEDNYWFNWTAMFETTLLTKPFFETYYNKMLELVPYCENQRYLVNNNTFFANMVTDGKSMVACNDWTRAGITDFLLDFVIMDLNKPYLKIPELLSQYCKSKSIEIPHFKERFLCMAYYKGLDVLRWHASIDDKESCRSIIKSISELEERSKSF